LYQIAKEICFTIENDGNEEIRKKVFWASYFNLSNFWLRISGLSYTISVIVFIYNISSLSRISVILLIILQQFHTRFELCLLNYKNKLLLPN
jgi:hypothetical protein